MVTKFPQVDATTSSGITLDKSVLPPKACTLNVTLYDLIVAVSNVNDIHPDEVLGV